MNSVRILLASLCLVLTPYFLLAQKTGIGTSTPSEQLHTTQGVRFEGLKSNGIKPLMIDSNGKLCTQQNFFSQIPNAVNILDNTCPPAQNNILITGMPNSVASSSISVKVNIAHTFDADLRLYLITPNSQMINLAYAKGGGGDNFTNTIFTDNTTNTLGSGSAPFTGMFKPDGDMTTICTTFSPSVTTFGALGGGSIDPNGYWFLLAQDAVGGDVGKIIDWEISFNGNFSNNNVAFRVAAPYQNVPDNTYYQIDYDAKDYDLENNFDLDNNIFNVPLDGLYHFDVATTLQTSVLSYCRSYIEVNGQIYKVYLNQLPSSGAFSGVSCQFSDNFYLHKGDYVRSYFVQSSGTTQPILSSLLFIGGSPNPGYISSFSGYKIN